MPTDDDKPATYERPRLVPLGNAHELLDVACPPPSAPQKPKEK